MKKLDITKVFTDGLEQTLVTHVSWHRYNDDNQDDNAEGTWDFPGELTNDEVVVKAETMVDEGIVVALNLQ